jgi:hypothetical protein
MKKFKQIIAALVMVLVVAVTIAAVSNPEKIGMFVSSDGTGNPGTWVALTGTGTPFTGTVNPSGMYVSTDGTGNPGTWVAATAATFAPPSTALSGQTIGYLPKSTSATGSTVSSSIDESVTNANTVTVNDPAFQVLNTTSGVTSTVKSLLNSSAGGATQQLDMGNTGAAAVVLFKVTGGFDWRIGMSGSTNFVLKDDSAATILIDSPLGSKHLKMNPIVAQGTQTVSGCSLSANVGGAWAGKFVSGTAGTCTVTITPGDTAPNGFSCWANDLTTPANVIHQTGTLSTTTATIAGTTATSDVVTWGCIAI